LWIANNQQNIVINFHQDFVASTLSRFFQGQADMGLFYGPNCSWENSLPKKENKKKSEMLLKKA
jgi:hypothetical protein